MYTWPAYEYFPTQDIIICTGPDEDQIGPDAAMQTWSWPRPITVTIRD